MKFDKDINGFKNINQKQIESNNFCIGYGIEIYIC